MNDLLADIRVCQTVFSATSNVSSTLIFRWWLKITSHLNKNIIHLRSSHRSFSVKKGVLRNFVKFTGKHLCQSLFFNKVAAPATLLKKETLTQVFSSEFYEISKNTCSTEHLWTTASDISVELPKNYQYNHSLKIKFLVFCKDFVTILIECFWFIWHRKNTLKLPKWLLPAIASVSLW